MTRVLLEGVSKVFAGQVRAVAEVNLDVRSGELLALVGPSGCGKSTLLRLLAGLETPSAGDIRFDNQRMNDIPPHRRRTAMVFQDEALQPHLNVRQNLEFGWKLRRSWWRRNGNTKERSLTHEEISEKIEQAAAVVGIGHLLERRPQQLSGGERQRVALAGAMVRKPSVLLLDEPLSHLDARLRGQLRAEIKQLQRRLNVTTIYVTHDQVEAMALGDRIAVMSNGALHQVGPPVEVYDRPCRKIVAELLGSPPMNFIDGVILRSAGDDGKLRFTGGGLQVDLSALQTAALDPWIGQPVELGVRPQHIRLRAAKPNGDEITGNVDSLANITMVETLGDSTILHLRTESKSQTTTLTSKQTERWTGGTIGPVQLVVDARHCLFFNPQTGEAIASK